MIVYSQNVDKLGIKGRLKYPFQTAFCGIIPFILISLFSKNKP